MEIYTEFAFGMTLKEDTPNSVIDILRYMVNDSLNEPAKLPDHPLFQTKRWTTMLRSDSGCFPGVPHKDLHKHRVGYDTRYHLTIRSRFKNYDYEIKLFLDWISNYVEDEYGEFVGYYRVEKHDNPNLIYIDKSEVSHPIQIGVIIEDEGRFEKKSLLEFMPNSWWDWVRRTPVW